jgi:hypothetical protein
MARTFIAAATFLAMGTVTLVSIDAAGPQHTAGAATSAPTSVQVYSNPN